MKKIIIFGFIVSLFFPFVSADALSSSELQSLGGNSIYYDPGCGVGESSYNDSYGPPGGLNFPDVTSIAALTSSINTYIANAEPSSPFVGLGSDFVSAGQQYNVNPALIVGLAYKEEQLGIDQDYNDDQSFDSFGVTGIAGYPDNSYGIVSFPSFKASINPVTEYVSSTYVNGGYNSQDLLQMMMHYTPDTPTAPNAANNAANLTSDVMYKILDGITTNALTPVGSVVDQSSVPACQTSSTTDTSYTGTVDGFSLSGPNTMAHFYQCSTPSGTQEPWKDDIYGDAGTICNGGCGITSLAMVIDTLTGSTETPDYYATKYAAYGSSGGTDWSLWPVAASDYKLKEIDLGKGQTALNEATSVIQQGGLVIISVWAGAFTTDGHIMVIRAVNNDGEYYLADPAAPSNDSTETTPYTSSYLINQGNMAHLWGFLPS